jgi:hypothetical protein
VILANEDNLFNYSNITFTVSYKDINEQYYFIINRLLIKLKALIITKSSSIDIYNVETSGELLIPILHFVVKGKISNQDLDAYLDYWTTEFKKII